jgi:hypothetical protein
MKYIVFNNCVGRNLSAHSKAHAARIFLGQDVSGKPRREEEPACYVEELGDHATPFWRVPSEDDGKA